MIQGSIEVPRAAYIQSYGNTTLEGSFSSPSDFDGTLTMIFGPWEIPGDGVG